VQWLPGTAEWAALPDLPAGRNCAASVRLPDGRTMLIGGMSGGQALASVLVLAADGSGWSDLPPLMGARDDAAAALLPDGKVLVAGGMSAPAADTALNTAELWDPATQKWTALPPMAHKRSEAAACVLPSGRVAGRADHWWGVRGVLTPLASPSDPSGLPAGLRQPSTGGSAPRARSRLWLTGR
jgi:hypothetical protein